MTNNTPPYVQGEDGTQPIPPTPQFPTALPNAIKPPSAPQHLTPLSQFQTPPPIIAFTVAADAEAFVNDTLTQQQIDVNNMAKLQRQQAEYYISTVLEQFWKNKIMMPLHEQITYFQWPASVTEPYKVKYKNLLFRQVTAEILDFGLITLLLEDPAIENIDINGHDIVWIRKSGGDKSIAQPIARDDEHLLSIMRRIAQWGGRRPEQLDVVKPILDMQLRDGSRFAGSFDISSRPSCSIRKHRIRAIALHDLVENNTISHECSAFLHAAVLAKLNIVISGGTNTGKTTLLRALLSAVPPYERIITVEDDFELMIDHENNLHPDVVALEAKAPNIEGIGGVDMDELVRATLRRSADRVIVGEVRGGEILQMLLAMSQGRAGSMGTIHADSAETALERMITYGSMAKEKPALATIIRLIATSIDVVIQLEAEASQQGGTTSRFISSIIEVAGTNQEVTGLLSNTIFAPDPINRHAKLKYNPSPYRAKRLQAAGWVPSSYGYEQERL